MSNEILIEYSFHFSGEFGRRNYKWHANIYIFKLQYLTRKENVANVKMRVTFWGSCGVLS